MPGRVARSMTAGGGIDIVVIPSFAVHSVTTSERVPGTITHGAPAAMAGSTTTAITFNDVVGRHTPTTAPGARSGVVDR
jgi:hypothetical protein